MDCAIEFPFWHYDGSESTPIQLDDLLHGNRFSWTGKHQSVRLTPDQPYAIWRVRTNA